MARRQHQLSRAAAVALVLSTISTAATPHDYEWHQRTKRANTVTTASSLSGKTFDYVIVGGGTAGLVLAGRLSENSSATVAVIEAGTDGSAVSEQILAPAQAYFGGIASKTSAYDWHYDTTAQSELNDREIYWPRGKVLGGSSAVNGLYMIRGSEIEHNSWASLYPGSNSTWGFDAIWPYMLKSENWTAPLAANSELAGMTTDASLHGTSGPIHYSYPGFLFANWIPTLANLGVGTRDPAGGENWGAYICTSAIDPTTWTRSYSKTGYLDPAASRSNLVVLTGFQATQITFSGTTATGVKFQAAANSTSSYTVKARQEVILAAGVIGTPQLLQLSGVGDSTLLTSLGISTVVDLPGVGMHLTDHLSGAMTFNTTGVEYTGDEIETNTTYAAAQLALWKAGDSSSLYNSPNDAVAYINLTTLFGAADAATLIAEIKANQSTLVQAYSTNSYIQAGYNATYEAEVRDIYPSEVGQAEILMSNTGTYGAYPNTKTIQIQAAIQHPLSRGSVKINSTSAFDPPVIDAGYLTHPADIQILRQAFKYARTISQTAPLSSILTELSPGSAVSTDAEWETWIRGVVSTEYHPAGTASMLPQSIGGVVDTALRVHGTSRLRVVDSSIVPVGLSAHMTAPLYGIAENSYNIIINSEKNSTTVSNDPSGSSSAAAASSTTTAKSPAGRLQFDSVVSVLAGAVTLAALLL
ncbi:alcohol oxidase [Meredithblackwellia eburnea MCA 4105]